jgi:hypothetical protein
LDYCYKLGFKVHKTFYSERIIVYRFQEKISLQTTKELIKDLMEWPMASEDTRGSTFRYIYDVMAQNTSSEVMSPRFTDDARAYLNQHAPCKRCYLFTNPCGCNTE